MANIIDRQKAAALIGEQVRPAILEDAPQKSVFMSLAKRLPNMTSNVTSMPVLNSLPMAYFVNGDNGYKQVSDMSWDKVTLYAEELAVIVPIPMAVLQDANYDIIGQIKPRVIEAIYNTIDRAVFYGLNKPTQWPEGIVQQATAAGNVVVPTADLYTDLLGPDGVWDKVEQDSHTVNGALAVPGMKAKLRDLRTADGYPIFKDTVQGSTKYAIDGSPLYITNVLPKEMATLLAGDFSQAVYAIREDIKFDILDQAVIQDPNDGKIIYNLAQQDMIALRVYMRMGWALPNYAKLGNEDRKGLPFAILAPGTPTVE